MEALILAAGYGTRLYPLTRDRPKPLLPVGGSPLLDHLAENLDRAAGLRRIVVVVNDRFEPELRRWADRIRGRLSTPVELLSDGTERPEERLGAVVDDDGRVRRFAEKPDEPPSRTAAAPLHVYRRGTLSLVRGYLDAGGEADAPGHFLEWLVPRREVRAWRMPAARHDVGTPEALRRTRRRFG